MSGPLEGLHVLDFGHCYAGPAVAMALADQGAEVVHIDRPGNPIVAGAADETLNRNKIRLTLDLKESRDRESALTLVKWADVVIENFRPGVMDRLGLGYDDCVKINTNVIYLSLPGFPSDDVPRRDLRAFEGIVMAAGGGFMDLSINRTLAGENPTFTPIPLASCYAAAHGAAAVMLALRERRKDGFGDRIEVDLYSSLLEGMAYSSYLIEGEPARYQSLRERELVRRRASGQTCGLDYDTILTLQDPFFRTYICQDGRPFYVVSLSHRSHPERVLQALDLWEEACDAGIPLIDPYTSSHTWPGNDPCTLYAQPLNSEWSRWLTSRMVEKFATKPAKAWERVFDQVGAVGLKVRTMSEWLRSDYARESGLVISVKGDVGETHQLGPLVWMESDPPRSASNWWHSTPLVDRRLAMQTTIPTKPSEQANCAASLENARPLWAADLKVVDLCNVIAGPTIGAMLARFGADVTNIQPVHPGIDPWMNIVFGIRAHVGKRSALVDLKSAEGKEILSTLLADADVLTTNMTGTQLEGLGIDLNELQADFPRLVCFVLDAFGGPTRRGEYVNYRGYDELGQAMTGVMTRFGGGLQTAELHAQVGAIDALTGVWSLFGTAIALYRREFTGSGQVARSSLAAIAQFIQLPFFIDRGEDDLAEGPGGRGLMGTNPLCHCYRMADSWVFLAGTTEDWPALCKALNLGYESESCDVAVVLRVLSLEKLTKQLATTAIEVHQIRSGATVRAEELCNEDNMGFANSLMEGRFTRDQNHPLGRPVTQAAIAAIRPKRAQIKEPNPAEKFGASTKSVLAKLGYSSEKIQMLLDEGVIGETWSEEYLPT